MKIRVGFVSNSSSSSFAVGNWTEKDATLREFMQMHEQIVRSLIERMYGWMKSLPQARSTSQVAEYAELVYSCHACNLPSAVGAGYTKEYEGKWDEILNATDELGVVFVKGKQTDVSFTNESANEADGFFRYFFDEATSPDCKKFSWNLNWNSQAEDYSGDYDA